jgi:uncharacterized protein YbjQ (UPF0145 family)
LSKKKKDLTSIEDMGEYIHALEQDDAAEAEFSTLQEDENGAIEPFGGDNPPDLPAGGNSSAFALEDSTFESADFGSDGTSEFGSESFASSDDGDSIFSVSSFDDATNSSTKLSAKSDTVTFPDLQSDLETEKDEDMITGMVEETLTASSPLPSASFLPPIDEPERDISKTEIEPEEKPYTANPSFKQPEAFEDVKKFAESSQWTGSSAEGNPSFSILLKNVRYVEDVNDIVTILKELSLLADSEDQVRGRLMRGQLLIPRISEFAAIFVAHKLRRFDIDIQVGLSDEIHPPKHHELPEVGVVSKHNLFQNQGHHFHFDDPKLEISQIIVAATPSLEGYQVLRYMGVASEHKMIDGHLVEDEGSTEIPLHYQELAQKLKAHALKANSNAVVGLNYQLTPVPSEYGVLGHKYRLSCTGNLVWVNKL